MIDAKAITGLHATTTQRWHRYGLDNPLEPPLDLQPPRAGEDLFEHPTRQPRHKGFLLLVCRQHQQNYRLWHEEDIARSPHVRDAELAQVKRNIDKLNQQRNDLIEQLDDYLLRELETAAIELQPDARLNTETPGSVIDRLSILALRIYHMGEQAGRTDASEQHRAKARARLEILDEQLADLSASLDELLDDVFSGRRRLKVYRQFKMYNDPTMNPYLYQPGKKPAA